MMNATPFGPSDPKAALLNLRIIWAVLLTGVIVFMFVVMVQQAAGRPPQPTAPFITIITGVSWGMLAITIPIGYFVRMQVYKRSWRGDVISPAGYTIGNLFLFGCCESVALFSSIALMLIGSVWPTIMPGLIAMAVMVINFPNGRAMHPPHMPKDVT